MIDLLVAWANAIPLEVFTGVEIVVLAGFALVAVYGIWARLKNRGADSKDRDEQDQTASPPGSSTT